MKKGGTTDPEEIAQKMGMGGMGHSGIGANTGAGTIPATQNMGLGMGQNPFGNFGGGNNFMSPFMMNNLNQPQPPTQQNEG